MTHVLDYWYGVTWNLSRRYMARWKESPDESYRFAVQSFFEPTDFLRTLRDWILFYVQSPPEDRSTHRQNPPGARRYSSIPYSQVLRRPSEVLRGYFFTKG